MEARPGAPPGRRSGGPDTNPDRLTVASLPGDIDTASMAHEPAYGVGQAAGLELGQRLRAVEDHDRAWRDGFRLGYDSGREDGYRAAVWELYGGADAWRAGQLVGVGPSFAELQERRKLTDEPCGRPGKCVGCSRCIRAEWVARHGGDYRGGPVAWTGPDGGDG
jgi:hypothetical protein